MMPKSKSKSQTFRDHAEDLASDLADRLGPRVESAREKAGPLLADARDKAGPVVADARRKAAPLIADARDKAAPALHDARDRFTAEVLPLVTAAVAAASEATEDARGEGKKRGKAAVAALRGEVEAPKKKRHRVRKALLVLGLGGAVAALAKKLSDRPATTTWQSPEDPGSSAGSSAGSSSGAHRAETADADESDDHGGSSPDVAAADAAASPHDATTPDNPAETVEVKKD